MTILKVMEWLVQSVEGADIEEVTDDMLEKMIITEEKLAVLFYEENDDVSTKILEALETIDDDLVHAIKISYPKPGFNNFHILKGCSGHFVCQD